MSEYIAGNDIKAGKPVYIGDDGKVYQPPDPQPDTSLAASLELTEKHQPTTDPDDIKGWRNKYADQVMDAFNVLDRILGYEHVVMKRVHDAFDAIENELAGRTTEPDGVEVTKEGADKLAAWVFSDDDPDDVGEGCHAGDCTWYASDNGRPEDGICICGYGLKRMRKGDYSQLVAEWRERPRTDPDGVGDGCVTCNGKGAYVVASGGLEPCRDCGGSGRRRIADEKPEASSDEPNDDDDYENRVPQPEPPSPTEGLREIWVVDGCAFFHKDGAEQYAKEISWEPENIIHVREVDPALDEWHAELVRLVGCVIEARDAMNMFMPKDLEALRMSERVEHMRDHLTKKPKRGE